MRRNSHLTFGCSRLLIAQGDNRALGDRRVCARGCVCERVHLPAYVDALLTLTRLLLAGAEEVYGESVMNHPALASGLPVLMKCPPGTVSLRWRGVRSSAAMLCGTRVCVRAEGMRGGVATEAHGRKLRRELLHPRSHPRSCSQPAVQAKHSCDYATTADMPRARRRTRSVCCVTLRRCLCCCSVCIFCFFHLYSLLHLCCGDHCRCLHPPCRNPLRYSHDIWSHHTHSPQEHGRRGCWLSQLLG